MQGNIKECDNVKIKKIQVPYELLENKNIPHHAVYLYIILKTVCVDNHVNIYGTKLRSEKYLDWKTPKTLKKYLHILKEHGYITYEFDDLPKRKAIELDICPLHKQQMYIQVSTEAINGVKECTKVTPIKKKKEGVELEILEDCKEMAVRLYYFYTKMYNDDIGKAFPSYKEITNKIGISGQYIKVINTLLKKKKLLEVTIGKWYEQQDEDGYIIRKRERNSYKPLK